MKLTHSIVLIATAGLFAGCAATVPTELAKARESYRHASAGPAAQLVPAELHKAEEALAKAEKSFLKDPESFHTRDLAYAAERKANLAEALAATASQRGNAAQANKDFQATQSNIMKETKEKLNKSRTDLAASERKGEAAADKLSTEQQNRLESEGRAIDMQSASASALSKEQQARTDSEKRASDAQSASADKLSAEQQSRLESEGRATDKQLASAKELSIEQEARKDADKRTIEMQSASANALSKEQQNRADSEKRAVDAQSASADKLSAEQQNRRESEGRAAEQQTASAKALLTEQEARKDADKRATDAQAALATLAGTREESRGLVITLSGSILFASNQSKLLPSAQSRLNEVAQALIETKGRKLDIEGHTDSKGTASYNQELSQLRAEAVRSYLISRGYPAEQIQAHGIGKERPIADNASSEGRANNRRVEIIVERQTNR
ncbi:MAG: OmpA family protein [Nitrospirae bacterium]|nr:OmpA family protein [Candidatus Manganitrophaceae bacterium]